MPRLLHYNSDLEDRIRAGDRVAFSELHRQLLLPLAKFFRHRGIAGDNVEGQIQETFLRLWTQRSKLDGASPTAFLFGIARNVAREHHRSCAPATSILRLHFARTGSR
jgi:DNA-directed RNA polymerase specialized sigma24 family protein